MTECEQRETWLDLSAAVAVDVDVVAVDDPLP